MSRFVSPCKSPPADGDVIVTKKKDKQMQATLGLKLFRARLIRGFKKRVGKNPLHSYKSRLIAT